MATIRQREAFNKIVESRATITDAMRQAKYSNGTVKNTQNLTNSIGFQELVAQYIPDDLISKKILMLIKHKDWRAVSDGLDKMLKIKGIGKDDPKGVFQQFNFNNLTDEQLQRAVEILTPKADTSGAIETKVQE